LRYLTPRPKYIAQPIGAGNFIEYLIRHNLKERRDNDVRNKKLFVAGLLILSLAGCSGMTTREQRILSGGAIGAGSGAAISIISGGSIAGGSAIGAAAGAIGGLIYDESKR